MVRLKHAEGTPGSDKGSLRLLLAAFITFRFLCILFMRPGGFITNHAPDQYYYFDIGRLAGSDRWPFFHFWMEYPPLMPWLVALAYRLSLYIPQWVEPILWFNVIFRLMLLPFDVGILVLIYACVRQMEPEERSIQIAGLWALLFAPLMTLLGWFEPMPLFFLVLALYGLLTRRPLLAGTAMGFGFMTKLFPILLLPMGWFVFRNTRQRFLCLGAAVLSAGLVILPPFIAAPAYTIAMFQGLTGRSSWETVWAVLEGYTGYGVVAPLAERVDPATAGFQIHPSRLPWLPISLAFATLYLFLLTRRIDWGDKRRIALFALLSLTLFMLYSKGYSPQWTTYIGTMALLALPPGRGLGYALLLDMFMVTEWPVMFVLLNRQHLLIALFLLRTVLTLLLSLDAGMRIFPVKRVGYIIQRITFPLALSLSIIGALAFIKPAWNTYVADRLWSEPLAPFIASLQDNSSSPDALIIIQPQLLERLRPYLPDYPIYLFPNVGGTPWEDVEQWLSTRLSSDSRVWFLYEDTETYAALGEEMRNWLDMHGCLTREMKYGAVWAGRYVVTSPLLLLSVGAEFENGVHLLKATIPQEGMVPGGSFCLQLQWQTGRPVSVDYAVFVHLVSESGQMITQGDNWPPIPTRMWTPGQIVTTTHELTLPPDVLPGSYILLTGLYEIQGGARPRLTEGGDTIRLAVVNVEPRR